MNRLDEVEDMKAQYWIAQHISDLFRNEPRNIGVFVRIGDNTAARFLGETNGGQIDGRKLRGLNHPDVYRQWVDYWRSQLSEESLDELVEHSGSHYRVLDAGQVTDTGRVDLPSATM